MTTFNDTQRHYFDDRYALKDATGTNVETEIPQMWDRVASAIADTEEEMLEFRRILGDFRFVPGGRILAGAGAESEKTFYNCYVIPCEARHPADHYPLDYPGDDSREAIFDTIKTMVDIMSRGGGVGINWSVLRPAKAYLKRISGTSSGPVGWMDVASAAVGEVIQGGSRRGAAMFMLDDWHPDILTFINAKRDNTKITNANVSVSVSDEFMTAVNDDSDWELVFPDTSHKAYNREWHGDIADWRSKGYPVNVHTVLPAREIWDAIAEGAWASGEPGVVFLGRYNALSTGQSVERLISVNPCGEQGLGAYAVCNLGAMNLDAYVKTDTDVVPGVDWKIFDFTQFASDVKVAVRFLDNIVDKNYYFLPQNKAIQMRLRRIGLSVMGLADALVRLRIRYGSPESIRFVEDVFRTMKDSAIEESEWLAFNKGAAPAWDHSMWQRPYLKEYLDRKNNGIVPDKGPGLRNIFLLTQAPTGTTSLLANVNSGIEPYFNLKTWRNDRTGGRYVYANAVQEVIGDTEHPLDYDFIVTSEGVSVEEHIAVQAAVQKYCDSSVSKTINAPRNQTVEETKKAFTLAYESGLKGIAYYRDGSRNVQVLYHENPNEVIEKLTQQVADLTAKLNFKQRLTEKQEFALDFLGIADICPSCEVGTVIYFDGCKQCNGSEGNEPCGWSAC